MMSGLIFAGYAAAVASGARRGRGFAIFAAVILAFPTFVGIALRGHMGIFDDAIPWLQAVAFLHVMSLSLGRRRMAWTRFVSIAGLWFVSCTFMAVPWGIAAALGFHPWWPWVPFALGTIGLWQSLWARRETVDLGLDRRDIGPLRRMPELRRVANPADRPLRIVQITDPHLGPFMSVGRLQRICERALARTPDLVLITGDLMTLESQHVDIVAAGLAPLSEARGRVFACLGNHDLEALPVVHEAYARLGIRLLVDEAETIETPAGPVQLVGCNFQWRDRAAHLASVCGRFPRTEGVLRLVLLHDPGAFTALPEGEGDLVLSGHTHGGQVGLVSLGMQQTILSAISSMPDHGPWGRGRDRLYVHRAQGHYGFPIRLGVPAEESLLRIHRLSVP